MPRPPERADPDSVAAINLLLPGWLKNDVVECAERSGLFVRDFIALVLYVWVREGRGLPVAPVGRPLPSVVDELRSYLVGERLLMPCGVSECGFVGEVVGGVEFCGVCGVRVS